MIELPTLDDIRGVIREALQTAGQPDEVFTLKQAAEYLQISQDNLRSLSQAGRVPCRDFGTGEKQYFRYSRRALEAWVAKTKDYE